MSVKIFLRRLFCTILFYLLYLFQTNLCFQYQEAKVVEKASIFLSFIKAKIWIKKICNLNKFFEFFFWNYLWMQYIEFCIPFIYSASHIFLFLSYVNLILLKKQKKIEKKFKNLIKLFTVYNPFSSFAITI
jgi:hypothetical protein